MQPRTEFRPAPLAGLAAACVGGLVVTYLGFVQTSAGERVDEAALAGGGAAGTRGVELAPDLLTTINVATLLLVIAVLVVQALTPGRVSL
ncbi:MAG: hypothetical protein ACR2OC_09065, partial [Solirubrobacterales bacterium]